MVENKRKFKQRQLVAALTCIGIGCIFILGCVSTKTPVSRSCITNFVQPVVPVKSYFVTDYCIYVIYGNAQLDSFPLISGGDGLTVATPYIIENYTFDLYAAGKDCFLHLESTTRHVLIRNCIFLNQDLIYSTGTGAIRLISCQNVRIENCTFRDMAWASVMVDDGSTNTISGNLIVNSGYTALWIFGSNTNITGNTIIDGGDYSPVFLDAATGFRVTGNYIEGGGVGIYINYGDGFHVVEGNHVKNMSVAGILAHYTSSNKIVNNTLEENYRGVSIQSETGDQVYLNTFVNNDMQITLYNFPVALQLDNGTQGNYWSDYVSLHPAASNDGITWNESYTVTNGVDEHPLVASPGCLILPPYASFVANTSNPVAGNAVAFTFTGHVFSPGMANFTWDFGDGSNSTEQDPVHVYASAGTYLPTLFVDDGTGKSAQAQALDPILVEGDLQPSVSLSPVPLSCDEGGQVQFIFNGSKGNEPSKFEWNFGDGTGTSSSQDPVHVYATNGTYTATVFILDRDGDVASGTVQVNVLNVVPVVNFTMNQTVVLVGVPVEFTFTGVANNTPCVFDWIFGDGSIPASGIAVVHVFTQPGMYNVSLNVTDSDGDIDRIYILIIASESLFPSSSFSANTTLIMEGSCISFVFAGQEGRYPATFIWNFGDGTTSNETDPVHCFSESGSYNVTLIVTGSDGHISSSSTIITVAGIEPEISGYPGIGFIVSLSIVSLLYIIVSRTKHK